MSHFEEWDEETEVFSEPNIIQFIGGQCGRFYIKIEYKNSISDRTKMRSN